MDRRAHRPPSPPTSTRIDHDTPLCNAPTQNPTVEKREMEASGFFFPLYLRVSPEDLPEGLAALHRLSLSLCPPQWRTCGRHL